MININWQNLRSAIEKKNWYLIGSRFRVLIHQMPRALFIRHSHIIDIIAVGIGLLVAIYLVLVLVFRPPVLVNTQPAQTGDLSVDVLRNLNNWVADRQREKERRIELNRIDIFKLSGN
jgi:hypothetical protein